MPGNHIFYLIRFEADGFDRDLVVTLALLL